MTSLKRKSVSTIIQTSEDGLAFNGDFGPMMRLLAKNLRGKRCVWTITEVTPEEEATLLDKNGPAWLEEIDDRKPTPTPMPTAGKLIGGEE